MARKTSLSSPDENSLWAILESTVAETGERYFAGLAQRLAQVMGTCGAWITEDLEGPRRLRTMAFWMDGQWIDDYQVEIAGTPCEAVIDTRKMVHVPDRLPDLFPAAHRIREGGFVSYLGMPLLDGDGRMLGHMAVIDRRADSR